MPVLVRATYRWWKYEREDFRSRYEEIIYHIIARNQKKKTENKEKIYQNEWSAKNR